MSAPATMMPRRALLGTGAALGTGLVAPKLLRPSVAGRPASVSRGPAVVRDPAVFFTDPNLNLQALFTVGAAGYGAAEYGEFATAVAGAHAGHGGYDRFYRAFRDMGQLADQFGHEALARGNRVAARGAFLRAASYLACSLYVAIGTSRPRRQPSAYRVMNEAWGRAAGLLEPAAEPVRIPYGRTSLPGWLLRPPGAAAGRRPTIIFNNGNDAQLIGLYVYGAAEAVALGYNALLFEGPGQGSMLFQRGIGFRPDWEAVITPIVDYLVGRPDVDPGRIALVGWSQGGALAARAAAFEHRLAALVLDPGVSDFMSAFHLPEQLVTLARTHPGEADRAWAKIFARLPASVRFSFTKASYPFRRPAFSALVRALAEYGTAAYLPKITAPVLVTQYQGETAFPGQGAAAARLIRSAATLHQFTAGAGCQFHDAPMAPQRRNQVLFDWLGGVL